jgi:hypothetical protein
MLFQKKKDSTPTLPQAEREAIVDLLHLCLYADAHISLKEGAFIADVVQVIGWDTKLSFSAYESRSIASVRAARVDEKSRTEFIEYAAQRLKSPGAKELAVSLCRDLAGVDGTSTREGTLLAQIRSTLGVP